MWIASKKISASRSQPLRKKTESLVQKLKAYKQKKLYLAAYSRRENIKFENINEFEDGSDKENTEQVLRLFMETELGFMDANSVEIQIP